MKNGAQLIEEERNRQILQEGWTPEHDDALNAYELSLAAKCYLVTAIGTASGLTPPRDWPWSEKHWKSSPGALRNLVKAGALIAAEIDRLQRMEAERP